MTSCRRFPVRARFSLRTLFGVVAAAAIVAWQAALWTDPAEKLRNSGANILYEGEYLDYGRGSLTIILGQVVADGAQVGVVLFHRSTITEDQLQLLASIESVEHVAFDGCVIPESCGDYLHRMPNLRGVCLYEAEISDAALLRLASLPSLRTIDVCGSMASPKARREFRRLRPDVALIEHR